MLTSNASTSSSTTVAAIEKAIDEKRVAAREPHRFPMRLTALGSSTSLSCFCENVSEGGCFTHLPPSSGLYVGQRCELEFTPEGSDQAAAHLAGEVCYATVVRTETIAKTAGTTVGTGLRFDQPLFF